MSVPFATAAPDPSHGSSGRPHPLRHLLLLASAVLALLAYQGIGATYYRGFAVPQGSGMYSLLAEEMTHYGMFMVFGLLVAVPLATVMAETGLSGSLTRLWRGVSGFGSPFALILAAALTLSCLAIARFVLGHAVTCDDEHVYRFIAETLRTGSVVAPSSGTDLAFFREQFVVLTPDVRYGKYPIGHPLLLAAAMALHVESLLVPLVTGLVALTVYAIGLRVFGRGTAAVAALLFVSSPQVLLTGATILSQPLSALCACTASLFILRAEGATRNAVWLLGAGACLGYGIVTRPLPGLLFAALAVAFVLLDGAAPGARTRLLRTAALVFPLSVAVAVMLAVNVAQADDPLATGYGSALSGEGRGVLGLTLGTFAQRAMSVVGSLIRANFWLFGWPLSLALCAFAPGGRKVALLWGMVAAEIAYRLISPKVGVNGTGPIYLYEAVPALCLLSAGGLREVVRRGTLPFLRDANQAAAAVFSLAVVSLAMFLPPKLQDLRRMGEAQRVVHTLIARQGVRHALVFHATVVPHWTRLSWAYFPPMNSPALDDDVLFMSLQRKEGGLRENLEFWRRRFPDRTAWFFGYVDGRPVLVPLSDFIDRFTQDPALLRPPTAGG